MSMSDETWPWYALQKKKKKGLEQDTKRGSHQWVLIYSWFNDTLAPEQKYSLLQRDDVFVASVLPGEPQSQVVGFGPESTGGGKGYCELLSHHKTHTCEGATCPEPLDFTQQKDLDTRMHYCVSNSCCCCCCYGRSTKPNSYKSKKQLLSQVMWPSTFQIHLCELTCRVKTSVHRPVCAVDTLLFCKLPNTSHI